MMEDSDRCLDSDCVNDISNATDSPQKKNQIIITNNFSQCIYKQNTHGILLQNISTGLELFWDDFPNKKIQSETWTNPPTSIVNSDFWKCFSLQSPKANCLRDEFTCTWE